FPATANCSVGKSLSLGAFKDTVGASNILHAEAAPVVVSEVEFSGVAVQVRVADVEIAAIDAALEYPEVVFDGVGMPEERADVFLGGVVDGAMPAKVAADRPIRAAFVGHQVACLAGVLNDDGLEVFGGH